MKQDLSALGWSTFFEEQWNRWGGESLVPARIAAEHRGSYQVWASTGAGPARISGHLQQELGRDRLPAVGDWVGLDGSPGPERIATVRLLLPRRTAFVRGAAGQEVRGQVVAANVDLVLVVCSLDTDYNLRRIERYVAAAWASGAQPVVVLSKADLCDEVAARLAEVERRVPAVPALALSAVHGDGLDLLRARLTPGTTAALLGSSGAGKSTLANALLGEEQMATGEVRERDGRGRHVTTHRQLIQLPGGGLVLDTPGMRELQLFDDDGLDETFDDLARLASECRFTDCLHGSEPGCALREAVAAGGIEADRLEHYLQLRREAIAYQRRHDARLRREDERTWGKMIREVERLKRWKRGR